MKNKKPILTLLFTTYCLLLTLSFCSSFAVSSEYWDQNPVVMAPGEEREIFVTLQNMAGDINLDAQGTITEGRNFIILNEGAKINTIKASQKVKIYMKISIPIDTPNGRHNAVISFKTTNVGTGDFSFGNSVEREIPIIVQSIEKEKTSMSAYWIIGILSILLLAAIIFIFMIKNKRRK